MLPVCGMQRYRVIACGPKIEEGDLRSEPSLFFEGIFLVAGGFAMLISDVGVSTAYQEQTASVD